MCNLICGMYFWYCYFVHFTDIIQYDAVIQLSDDFYRTSNQKVSERVSDLINEV